MRCWAGRLAFGLIFVHPLQERPHVGSASDADLVGHSFAVANLEAKAFSALVICTLYSPHPSPFRYVVQEIRVLLIHRAKTAIKPANLGECTRGKFTVQHGAWSDSAEPGFPELCQQPFQRMLVQVQPHANLALGTYTKVLRAYAKFQHWFGTEFVFRGARGWEIHVDGL